MGTLYYSKDLRMAIADEPMSLSKEEDALFSVTSADNVLDLQELVTYFIKFYDEVPEFFNRITSRGRSSCFIQKEYPGHLFEVNFRNSVGMTRLGPPQLRITNKKIPEDLYQSMLSYISGKYANLVFSFDVPLGQSYKKRAPGIDIPYVEHLFLKRYLLDSSPDLDGIAALIIANPHMRLHSEHRISPIEDIVSLQPSLLFKTLTKTDDFAVLRSDHQFLSTGLGKILNRKTAKNLYPTRMLEEYRYHTVDTIENRFVKHFLECIEHRLKSLSETMRGTSGSYLNPNIQCDLETLARKIAIFLKDPMWQDVGMMSFIPANSQVLQRREGYRQLFELYSLLQLCTRCDFDAEDFRNLLETKDTPTLFEYWSFFAIKGVLDGISRGVSSCNIISEYPLEQKVKIGIRIQYKDSVNLWFNRYLAGSPGCQPEGGKIIYENINESYSHSMKPDIIISRDDNLLIFDAIHSALVNCA